jgi:hypothetical protein
VSKIDLELKYIGNGIFQAADVEYCESVLKPNDAAIFRYVKWTANKARTIRQNAALHKYFVRLFNALNDAGLDMRKVLKPEIEIPWTLSSVKEYLWRPVQRIMLEKDSTTELETSEVDKVYRVLDRKMLEKGVNVAFPSVSNHGLD